MRFTDVKRGQVFVYDEVSPWHDGNIKHEHRQRLVCVVSKVDARGFDYVVVRLVSESGTPPYDWARPAAGGGGVAAFAVNDGFFKMEPPTEADRAALARQKPLGGSRPPSLR